MTLFWDENDVVVLTIKLNDHLMMYIDFIEYIQHIISDCWYKSLIDPLECFTWSGWSGLKSIAAWLNSNTFESTMIKYSSLCIIYNHIINHWRILWSYWCLWWRYNGSYVRIFASNDMLLIFIFNLFLPSQIFSILMLS